MFDFSTLKGKLIVSCQALPDEPLHGSFIMGKMARAAEEGGAGAIRSQGMADILAIKEACSLPVIGLVKRDYDDSDIYITPTKKEVDELLATGCDVISLDMTNRKRPHGERIEDLIAQIHAAGRAVQADVSTFEEGVQAEKLGADAISTAMSGYTPYSPQLNGPDLDIVRRLVQAVKIPVFGEGRIHEAADLRAMMATGAYGAVIGGAITRPQQITKRFVEAMA